MKFGLRIGTKDLGAGLLFLAFGLFFVIDGLVRLRLGTGMRMGPGYFPVSVGVLLSVIGVVCIITSVGRSDGPIGSVPWRGIVLILGAIVAFALTVNGLGLVLALPLSVTVAAFASRKARLGTVLASAVVLTIFCVLVFNYGLGIPLPLFGTWITP
ncbi:MAG: tripartite tricarboxylate transporter TctB family protein [Alphaproteobacteria bacterium]